MRYKLSVVFKKHPRPLVSKLQRGLSRVLAIGKVVTREGVPQGILWIFMASFNDETSKIGRT